MFYYYKSIDYWPMSTAFTIVAGLAVLGFLFVLLVAPHLIWRSFVSTWPVQLVARLFGRR